MAPPFHLDPVDQIALDIFVRLVAARVTKPGPMDLAGLVKQAYDAADAFVVDVQVRHGRPPAPAGGPVPPRGTIPRP